MGQIWPTSYPASVFVCFKKGNGVTPKRSNLQPQNKCTFLAESHFHAVGNKRQLNMLITTCLQLVLRWQVFPALNMFVFSCTAGVFPALQDFVPALQVFCLHCRCLCFLGVQDLSCTAYFVSCTADVCVFLHCVFFCVWGGQHDPVYPLLNGVMCEKSNTSALQDLFLALQDLFLALQLSVFETCSFHQVMPALKTIVRGLTSRLSVKAFAGPNRTFYPTYLQGRAGHTSSSQCFPPLCFFLFFEVASPFCNRSITPFRCYLISHLLNGTIALIGYCLSPVAPLRTRLQSASRSEKHMCKTYIYIYIYTPLRMLSLAMRTILSTRGVTENVNSKRQPVMPPPSHNCSTR